MPQFILDLAQQAVADSCLGHQYTRSEGQMKLVNVLSDFYADRIGRKLDPMKEIVTTVGASEGMTRFFDW